MHGLFKHSLHEPCKTLQGLSKMVLANVIAFWRYCTVLLPCKSLCLQITTQVNKIKKSVRCDLAFTFVKLSETASNFGKICLVLEIKKAAILIKTHFCWKRGYIKERLFLINMRKGFMLIRATNWQLPFLYQLFPFQKTKQNKKKHCGTLFKVLHTLTFYMKINQFNIFFHMVWDKWQFFLPV